MDRSRAQSIAGAGPSTGLARGLDQALVLANRLSYGLIWGAGTLIFLAAVLVSVDVVIRRVIHVSVQGADELSGYALAIGASWAYTYTLLQRANIRIDGLYLLAPHRLRALLDIVALLSLVLFIGILSYYAIDVVATSWGFGSRATTPLQTPMWIPQGMWLAGMLVFFVTLVLLVLRIVVAFATGDLDRISTLAGARTISEDAADEISTAREISRDSDLLRN